MKLLSRYILVGILLSPITIFGQLEKTFEPVKIELHTSSGCIISIDKETIITIQKSGIQIIYKELSYDNEAYTGNIPRSLVDEYVTRLSEINIQELKNEYLCERKTTAAMVGNLSIVYKDFDTLSKKSISFQEPTNCDLEFSQLFNLIYRYKYFAIASISSLESKNPLIQKEAIYIIGDAHGYKEVCKEVLRVHAYSKNRKKMLKVIQDLKEQNIDTLAKSWNTNRHRLEYILNTAYTNINEMKED